MGKYFWDTDQESDSKAPARNENDELRAALHSMEILIDQLDHLYAQYFARYEKRPPIEKRRMLDAKMTQLESAVKPTPDLKFRFGAVQSKYTTFRDRWEKQLKDFESGKARGRS